MLRDFASRSERRGYRAVGLVQAGHHCLDAPKLSAMLVHTGEELQLFQNLGACATGCRLDVGQLLDAGARVAGAIEPGRRPRDRQPVRRQEREGKGLSYLVERASSADIPVVIAVPSHRFADWIRFADGMSVRLPATATRWTPGGARSRRETAGVVGSDHQTVCEVFK